MANVHKILRKVESDNRNHSIKEDNRYDETAYKIGLISQFLTGRGGAKTVSVAIERALIGHGRNVVRYMPSRHLSPPLQGLRGSALARRALRQSCDMLIYTDWVNGTPRHDKPVIVYEHSAQLLESSYWATEIKQPSAPPRTLARMARRVPYLAHHLMWRYTRAAKRRTRASMLKHTPMYIIANSRHTAARLAKAGLDSRVIYPPVDVSYMTQPQELHADRIGVVTLGRIVPPKELEFIINAVGRNMPLHVVGTAMQDPRYASSLQKRHPHVKYHFDAEKRRILQQGAVYMHANPEDFGIATVEAMAAGCIPIVPDVWGHRETVPWPELRYKYQCLDDARAKLRMALSGKFDDWVPKIKEHVWQFDTSTFTTQLLDVVRRVEATNAPAQ